VQLPVVVVETCTDVIPVRGRGNCATCFHFSQPDYPGERGFCFGGWDDVPFEPPPPWPDVLPTDSCARWEHVDDPHARDCTVERR